MASIRLPRFIVLESKSNGSYLRYEKEDGEIHGYIKCSEEEVAVSPYVKYEVETPKMETLSTKNLVHIRCCYNNKYLARCGKDSNWITASAQKTEEHQSEWSCTLFEPLFTNGDNANDVQFRHVQLDLLVGVDNDANGSYQTCLRAMENKQSKLNFDCDEEDLLAQIKRLESNYFRVINWESLLVLPKYVAFKGLNGKYLRVFRDSPHDLIFDACDIGDPTTSYEVVPTRDGNIHLKSLCLERFWYRNSGTEYNWVLVQSDDTYNTTDETFQPISAEKNKNVIALRCLGNNMFCRLFYDGREGVSFKGDYLRADMSTISKDAHIEVVEPVMSRDIYNVVFRPMDGRIYGESIITMASGDAFNRTNVNDTVQLKFSYKDTEERTWNFSASWRFGITASVASGVPKIAEGKVEISSHVTLGVQYTTTYKSTKDVETTYTVTVPPMTRVKISLIATQGTCDVPYSYTQCDMLTSGKRVTYNKDDGIFTGTNCYNFKYEAKEEAL